MSCCCHAALPGDSRAVISRSGRAIDLTRDHKPHEPGELQRITAVGGYVCEGGLLCGELGVARAIGDFHLPQLKPAHGARPCVILALGARGMCAVLWLYGIPVCCQWHCKLSTAAKSSAGRFRVMAGLGACVACFLVSCHAVLCNALGWAHCIVLLLLIALLLQQLLLRC